jgi:hypothetical protein
MLRCKKASSRIRHDCGPSGLIHDFNIEFGRFLEL